VTVTAAARAAAAAAAGGTVAVRPTGTVTVTRRPHKPEPAVTSHESSLAHWHNLIGIHLKFKLRIRPPGNDHRKEVILIQIQVVWIQVAHSGRIGKRYLN
jgi:hypothetical protein